jgi:hypothetical protein
VSRKDDGGQAFPGTYLEKEGMSLRDYFAGQALAGMMADLKTYDFQDCIGSKISE